MGMTFEQELAQTIAAAIKPMMDGLKAVRGEIATWDARWNDVGALRERVAVLEVRAPVPGPMGPKGDDGRSGMDGKNGQDGVNGKDGRDGIDGKDGAPGLNGKDGIGLVGPEGKPGRDGIDGKDGLNGKDGSPGLNGKDGAPGPPGSAGEIPTVWHDEIVALTKRLDTWPMPADLAADDIAASLTGMLQKELSGVMIAAPILMQKRVIRDGNGKVDRVIEEPVSH